MYSLYREVDDSGILLDEKRVLRKTLKRVSKTAGIANRYVINDKYK